MKIWTLALHANLTACVVLGINAHSFANEYQAPTQGHSDAVAGGNGERRPSQIARQPRSQHRQKTAMSRDKAAVEKREATKAMPWFEVDPNRARLPTMGEGSPANKGASSVPSAKWARDPVDFDYKVNGSNDFRMLPRFDTNQNPDGAMGRGEGASGEVGVNLHF